MKYFDILTIFPDVITSYTNESILGRAQKKKLIKISAHDLRSYTKDKHQKVDDRPFGGGPGMVMQVEPFDRAIKKVTRNKKQGTRDKRKTRVVLTSAAGQKFTQKVARRLAKYEQGVFVCGRRDG